MDCVTGFEKTAKIRQESRSQEHELETNAGRSGADLPSFERSGLAGFNLETLLKKVRSKVQPAYPGNNPQAALRTLHVT